MCFQRCVDNINTRKLDEYEVKCVEDCSQKFVTYNNKLMQNFVKAQQEIVNKRMKLADEEQKALEEQQQKELKSQSLVASQELSVSAE